MSFYSPYQFALFRIVLGSGLAFQLLRLAPHAAELLSSDGMPHEPRLRWAFPSLLALWNSGEFATGLVLAMAGLSLLFALGIARPLVAVLLWYGLACLMNENYVGGPEMPFLGWAFLASAIVPPGEPLRLSRRPADAAWEMPRSIWIGAWCLLAAGYSLSGIAKFKSDVWIEGTMFRELLEWPWARGGWLRDGAAALPLAAHQALTYAALAGESLFLPLCALALTRKLAWAVMASMHIGMALLFDEADVAFGMLVFHLFVFDARWIPRRPGPGRPGPAG